MTNVALMAGFNTIQW